jgi:hypothetical protein
MMMTRVTSGSSNRHPLAFFVSTSLAACAVQPETEEAVAPP